MVKSLQFTTAVYQLQLALSKSARKQLQNLNILCIKLSVLQQGFHGTVLFRKTYTGVPWVLRVHWGFLAF